jgi:biotin carboxyl carrier protein
MNVVETEPGVFSVIIDGAAYEVRALGNDYTVNGHRIEVKLEDPRQWKRTSGGAAGSGKVQITALMPGKVVRVLVEPGDEVTAGQGILVVEAMKMQNELKSPRDGRVTSIKVRADESVNAGAVLAVIE